MGGSGVAVLVSGVGDGKTGARATGGGGTAVTSGTTTEGWSSLTVFLTAVVGVADAGGLLLSTGVEATGFGATGLEAKGLGAKGLGATDADGRSRVANA